MQKENENDGGEDDEQVDTLYIGSNEIKVAVEKLRAELNLARLDTNQSMTVKEWKKIETSGNDDEIIVLEHQENEPSMDC